jgi:hypothetical protein
VFSRDALRATWETVVALFVEFVLVLKVSCFHAFFCFSTWLLRFGDFGVNMQLVMQF